MLTWMSRPQASPRVSHVSKERFLFLDRDGVINVNRADYVKCWEEFIFYPDALEALAWLKQERIHVIIISNQSALGRGIMTWRDFWKIHRCMVEAIRNHGGDLLAAYYCPHAPDVNCSCRKPSPAMLLEAARTYNVDLNSSTFIGDQPTDMEAARRAQCQAALLIRDPEPAARPQQAFSTQPIQYHHSLMDLVTLLFATR